MQIIFYFEIYLPFSASGSLRQGNASLARLRLTPTLVRSESDGIAIATVRSRVNDIGGFVRFGRKAR